MFRGAAKRGWFSLCERPGCTLEQTCSGGENRADVPGHSYRFGKPGESARAIGRCTGDDRIVAPLTDVTRITVTTLILLDYP
jgi:hypothetical protein